MGPNGIRNRQITCVGCSGCVVATKGHHQCIFAASGFTQDGVEYVPCGTAYHLGCIVVGEPFRSRLAKDKGLSFPKVSIVPNFICEACTVRAMLSRELVQDSKDRALLMLERMRMIDQACAWDIKTLGAYQSHLRRIRQFETDFGVTGLKSSTLLKPPTSEAIALMWIQQHYALQTPRKTHATTGDRVTYGSARTIRSAASQYYTWDMQIAHPGRAMRDGQRRGHLTAGCIPTDQLGYALMTTGMAKRMGDDSTPSVAVNFNQVRRICDILEEEWSGPISIGHQRELAAAAVTHVGAWLSWLRSTELFSIDWEDVTITPPDRHLEKGLQENVGVIEMNLLAETKTNRTKVADVVVAYTTLASGLSLGTWMERLRRLWPDHDDQGVPMIRGADGKRFTSSYFRHHFLYPWLYRLQAEGDPTLRAYTREDGNRIEDKFYSMNSYRRGGSSYVSKRRSGKRRATAVEVYEHGRWRLKRQSENMPTRYREFTLEDRIYVTLLCM